MRWLINYIRSCFCQHEWELIFNSHVTVSGSYCEYDQKTYRCKKCGYSKRYRSH